MFFFYPGIFFISYIIKIQKKLQKNNELALAEQIMPLCQYSLFILGTHPDLGFPKTFCILYIGENEALDVDGECGRIRYYSPDLPADFHVSNGISGPFYFKNGGERVKKN